MTSSGPYLYRILPFERAVQILERNELYFANPASWEDPYESLLSHQHSEYLFAQCWCKNAVSDAMWRIYSSNSLGVRIRTTRARLRSTLEDASASDGFRFKLKDVKYLPQDDLENEFSKIADSLAQRHSYNDSIASLFLKRNAFRHEAEVRVVLTAPTERAAPTFLRVQVTSAWLIDSVLIDPRAPDEYVRAFQHYIKDKLAFPGTVLKSALYSPRESYDV